MMDDRNSGTSELPSAGTPTTEGPQVTIPDSVYTEIERRAARTEFDSTDEYVTFVLRSLLGELDQQDGDETQDEGSEELQERLESLGYL